MKNLFLCYITILLFGAAINIKATNTDSLYVRVHFLHGSKPKKKFRYEEDRWFGGLLGGHAGIEIEKNVILNFTPKARFHIFAKRKIINSRFITHDTVSFYGILGGHPDSVKRTIIKIAISPTQKAVLDSISRMYLERSPYDYAFFGMRCGAAAYDVLANADIVKKYSFGKTWRKTFYPRKLRRRLESGAYAKGYLVERRRGTCRRIWEKD
jgi:hypothetical protein